MDTENIVYYCSNKDVSSDQTQVQLTFVPDSTGLNDNTFWDDNGPTGADQIIINVTSPNLFDFFQANAKYNFAISLYVAPADSDGSDS